MTRRNILFFNVAPFYAQIQYYYTEPHHPPPR